jgi:16S rRNA (cytidine1402-2'-O)-methyltransferase
MQTQTGTLYLIATPIGNLEDITLRALRLLKEVDLIACEDTRHTQKLLNHFDIHTKTVSYHEHNEESRAVELVARLKEGKTIALVSDAGTPAISDPGFRLVRAAIEAGARVESVPGAVAFVTALAASGLPTDQIYFGGFLPAKTHARRARLQSLRALDATLIFYESPHRLAATLKDAFEVLGERASVVARELTKRHEEFARGRLSELIEKFSNAPQARGEFVLLIDRAEIHRANDASEKEISPSIATQDINQQLVALIAALEREGLDHRAALKRVARQLGLTRDEAYRRLISARAK